MNENFVSREQLLLLPERVRKAEETNVSAKIYDYLFEIGSYKENMRILFVAAGGSYPAAMAAAHSVRHELKIAYVNVQTPQNALRTICQFDSVYGWKCYPSYDLVIGISYSGKTPDIIAVYKACKERGEKFLLITGEEKNKLKEYYEEDEKLKILSYFNSADDTGKEKGMISMFSTLMPAILFDDYVRTSHTEHYFELYKEDLKDGEKFVSRLDISAIAARILKVPVIHVFYEWETAPVAYDIESKFTESGVANVILHEKKNFSHGRYTILYNQDFAAIINLNRYEFSKDFFSTEYDRLLTNFIVELCKKKEVPYIEISEDGRFIPAWNISKLCILPYFITAIGEALNIDISKPLKPFPKEAICLYDYKGKF